MKTKKNHQKHPPPHIPKFIKNIKLETVTYKQRPERYINTEAKNQKPCLPSSEAGKRADSSSYQCGTWESGPCNS